MSRENDVTDLVKFTNPLSEEAQSPKAAVAVTKVPVSLFETPFKALGASGGTAAFFRVEYKDDEWRTDKTQAGVPIDSKDYWIGKDLARARDEVAFYEEAQKVQPRSSHLLAAAVRMLVFCLGAADGSSLSVLQAHGSWRRYALLCLRSASAKKAGKC